MAGSGNFRDNHPAAALRHYYDAELLRNAKSNENALCHYSFSVECAQKALLCWSTGMPESVVEKSVRQAGHSIDDSWNKVQLYLNGLSSLDCRLSSALPNTDLPNKLYENHPGRRYWKCYPVTEQEILDCRIFAQQMEQTIISMILDGLITP